MEINVTELIENEYLADYSNSIAGSGRNDIARITWQNALNSPVTLVSGMEEIQECKDYFKEFGAWTKEEIAEWSDNEVNALLVQLVSGDAREYLAAKEEDRFDDYMEIQGGSLYQGDDGDYWYYVGI